MLTRWSDPLMRLRLMGLVEGTTLLLLLGLAVPLKHLGGEPRLVTLLGPVHGLAFLLYAWCAVEAVSGGGWSRRDAARVLLAAIVPFGPFANDAWLRRRQRSRPVA